MTHEVVNFGIRTTLSYLGPHCLFDLFKAQILASLCFLHLEAVPTTQGLGVGVTMGPRLGPGALTFHLSEWEWESCGPGQDLHRQDLGASPGPGPAIMPRGVQAAFLPVGGREVCGLKDPPFRCEGNSRMF